MTAIVRPRLDRVTLGVTLGLPCVTSLVLMLWAPGAITSSSYAVVVALLLAAAAIVINTWNNAQATGSLGQLLYETDAVAGSPAAAQTRWDRWIARADETAAQGRRQALLVLSLAVTGAIVAAWLL